MIIYRGKSLIGDSVSHAAFAQLLDQAIATRSDKCFLLIRGDGVRLQVILDLEAARLIQGTRLMLCVAWQPDHCQVTYHSSYFEGPKRYHGLSQTYTASFDNFADSHLAKKAIEEFFRGRGRGSMLEFVDLTSGQHDPEIFTFPEPMTREESTQRKRVTRKMKVPDELRTEMQSVCELLDEVARDPDENIDFDDAIQVGSLCGGRHPRTDQYHFSYYLDSGDVWSFEVPRTILDGIADGSIASFKFRVTSKK